MYTDKTIAAISTAFGRGGVALIRISGDEAIKIAEKVFCSRSKKKLEEAESGKVVYGDIIKGQERIDDGIFTVFRAPHSYTGENVVEISCHGGILITEKVLSAVFESGAEPAAAGEFTKRAYVNGKLSLSQAEAVGLIIDAENDEQLKLASASEKGVFKRKCDFLYEKICTLVTNVYAGADFPDEDLTILSQDEVLSELYLLEGELCELSGSYKVGRAVFEGIPTVIAGKPNTGKSSLLNRLVGRDRAIVTDVAGTTRDTIEESVNCNKIILRLCDTAGIHKTDDEVEKIGVERSLEKLGEAELILAVFDSSRPLDNEDRELIDTISKTRAVKLAVLNKSDCKGKISASDLEVFGVFEDVLQTSAGINDNKTNGVDALKDKICHLFAEGELDYNNKAVVINARQNASVTKTLSYVQAAIKCIQSGFGSDTAGFELEAALCELGELDGRRVSEEIVDGIFHHFCVGK